MEPSFQCMICACRTIGWLQRAEVMALQPRRLPSAIRLLLIGSIELAASNSSGLRRHCARNCCSGASLQCLACAACKGVDAYCDAQPADSLGGRLCLERTTVFSHPKRRAQAVQRGAHIRSGAFRGFVFFAGEQTQPTCPICDTPVTPCFPIYQRTLSPPRRRALGSASPLLYRKLSPGGLSHGEQRRGQLC